VGPNGKVKRGQKRSYRETYYMGEEKTWGKIIPDQVRREGKADTRKEDQAK